MLKEERSESKDGVMIFGIVYIAISATLKTLLLSAVFFGLSVEKRYEQFYRVLFLSTPMPANVPLGNKPTHKKNTVQKAKHKLIRYAWLICMASIMAIPSPAYVFSSMLFTVFVSFMILDEMG